MKKELMKESTEYLKAILIGIIIFVLIRTFLFTNYIVNGESMMPTLEEGNKLIVNKISTQIGKLNRFDVIVFHATEEEDYVKRIIGLPGDSVEYRNDQLYINGKKYDEPYLDHYKRENQEGYLTENFFLKEITGKNTVPGDMLFVLGDNRKGSWDSRDFGFIKIDQVVGKVNLRYWPLTDFDTSL
ncbi:signal peptidase I [Bacillus aquiflavi]|uniref:Signal peptidase I n=1 Tax=Bacillus aquiflavi TaxID=2672567 RepID=A0A6B3VX41_9BACI|nr:signal peptidase I [Bacillus aquiflavi]MBA4535710.1 signal peptidase I [Bacillus aquiflavi]NEY80086.1 signal peptidase I [Bacillus aquiflavi]